MKLQIALDLCSLDEAREVLDDVLEYVDIVEVGLLHSEYGYGALTALRREYPNASFLVDLKLADGGALVGDAKAHGADYATVLGVMDDATVGEAIQVGKEVGIGVVVDMTGCRNLYERVLEVDELGAEYINIHTPADLQARGVTPFDQLAVARLAAKRAKLSVAGGINPSTIGVAMDLGAEIVVVGQALIDPAVRRQNGLRLREAIEARRA